MPRVSVVIPAYNPGDLLRRAVESVRAQTEPDFECIVVDDGSSQDLSWVTRLDDPRITLVRQANHGVSVARNVGVAHSSADLIAFLDQDDEWLPTKLEKQLVTVAAEPEAAFWHTGFEWVWPDQVMQAPGSSVTYHGLLGVQRALLSSCMVPRDHYLAVGGHDPLLRQAQDLDLFLRLTLWGGPAPATTDCLVRYHLHGQNASADYWRASREHLGILASHDSRARELGDETALRAIEVGRRRTRELYAFQAIDRARASLAARDARGVARHSRHAAQLSPRVLGSGVGQAIAARVVRRTSGAGKDGQSALGNSRTG